MPRDKNNPIGQYVLDEHGNPVPCPDTLKWARLFEDDKRRLKYDQVGALTVSTVFLGLDHRFGGEGPPILWETMTFMQDDGGDTEWYEQERYSSRQAAYEGHARAVTKAREIMARSKAVKIGAKADV